MVSFNLQIFQTAFGKSPEIIARAPGRIEFIGNHTDYNGGCVIGSTIDRDVVVAIAPRKDPEIHLASSCMKEKVVTSIHNIAPGTGSSSWANYPLGVLNVLIGKGIPIENGFSMWIDGDLPIGSGMSSSAALELSTALGILSLNSIDMDRMKIVTLCRRAENEFVGVPCGILDQTVSAFGGPNHLIHIDCNLELISEIPFPVGCQLWIFDSLKKHALIDSRYAERNRECREAFRILQNEDPQYNCLAQISPEIIRSSKKKLGDTLYRRALHVTEENSRVRATVEALNKHDFDTVGKLLNASHNSSKIFFENSTPELDELIKILSSMPCFLGSRLTGGGFGGAVMALAKTDNDLKMSIEELKQIYLRKFGYFPRIIQLKPGLAASVSTP
ncbi:MAG: Galactokinase [Candidatus Moanabacter tarae]|uniref:Galactokinase n=1 Tax=Candidatus Moanibacter tarae TaxID=2200854 RepID=A0A2Z4AC21_9BACT|nr:MAG: Galactokinase [Candidatus Moanabacter tarae]|tara:strand:+ start:10083 stop:11246 length:1164 start_codon:yes stop_codon:yes gene_type:complete